MFQNRPKSFDHTGIWFSMILWSQSRSLIRLLKDKCGAKICCGCFKSAGTRPFFLHRAHLFPSMLIFLILFLFLSFQQIIKRCNIARYYLQNFIRPKKDQSSFLVYGDLCAYVVFISNEAAFIMSSATKSSNISSFFLKTHHLSLVRHKLDTCMVSNISYRRSECSESFFKNMLKSFKYGRPKLNNAPRENFVHQALKYCWDITWSHGHFIEFIFAPLK